MEFRVYFCYVTHRKIYFLFLFIHEPCGVLLIVVCGLLWSHHVDLCVHALHIVAGFFWSGAQYDVSLCSWLVQSLLDLMAFGI